MSPGFPLKRKRSSEQWKHVSLEVTLNLPMCLKRHHQTMSPAVICSPGIWRSSYQVLHCSAWAGGGILQSQHWSDHTSAVCRPEGRGGGRGARSNTFTSSKQGQHFKTKCASVIDVKHSWMCFSFIGLQSPTFFHRSFHPGTSPPAMWRTVTPSRLNCPANLYQKPTRWDCRMSTCPCKVTFAKTILKVVTFYRFIMQPF